MSRKPLRLFLKGTGLVQDSQRKMKSHGPTITNQTDKDTSHRSLSITIGSDAKRMPMGKEGTGLNGPSGKSHQNMVLWGHPVPLLWTGTNTHHPPPSLKWTLSLRSQCKDGLGMEGG